MKRSRKKRYGLFALALGGLKKTAQDTVIFQSFFGARALDDFAHDDHGAQTPFGLIIGRGDRRNDGFPGPVRGQWLVVSGRRRMREIRPSGLEGDVRRLLARRQTAALAKL